MFPHNFCNESIQPTIMYTGLSIPFYSQKNMNESSTVCDSVTKKRVRPVSNAARERSRVKTLRSAFLDLQETLPSVPPDTKLSKLDVLILATTYITHLMKTLESADQVGNTDDEASSVPLFHPVKKWPMRTRLYDGILDSTKPVAATKRRKVCSLKSLSLLTSQSQVLNCGITSDEVMP